MRALETIRRQYNADNGEGRAAIADAITSTAISIGFTLAYFQVVNFLGARYPKGTQEALGFVGINDYLHWENLGIVASIATLTFLWSYVAIIVTSRQKRPRLAKRSFSLTAGALIMAMAGTTGVGMFIVQQLSLSSFLESMTALGFIAVPAALRITSPGAFSYRCPDFTTIVGSTSEIDETP